MRKKHGHATIRLSVQSRASLIAFGWTDNRIRAEVRAKNIRRLHHGWYMAGGVWDELYWEEKHLAHVIAVMADADASAGQMPVACRESAGVVHGLPLFGRPPDRVHLLCADGRLAASTRDVVRHREAHDGADIVEVGGIRCTSLARTVGDIARGCRVETAVACADTAMRRVAMRADGTYDWDAAGRFRREVHAVLARLRGARGVRRARWVIDFADGRAQLPGESVTRLRLAQMGIAVLGLQVGVDAPSGGTYFVDLDTECGWLEFDGKPKYLDEAMRHGRSADEVVLDEKKREDWIRARTGRPMIRLGDEHIRDLAAFIEHFAAYDIHPPLQRPSPDPAPPVFG